MGRDPVEEARRHPLHAPLELDLIDRLAAALSAGADVPCFADAFTARTWLRAEAMRRLRAVRPEEHADLVASAEVDALAPGCEGLGVASAHRQMDTP